MNLEELRKCTDENTVLVFDYDQIAYLSASVLEETRIKATHISSGVSKEFRNKTEFWGRKKNSLEGSWLGDQNVMREAQGKRPFTREEFEIESVQIPPEKSHVLYAAKQKVNAICEHLGIEKYFGVLGKGETFRHELLLPEKYKSNRDTTPRPLLLTDAKDYLHETHGGVYVTGIEADDKLTTYGYKGHADFKRTGKYSYIPVTMDKDSNSTPQLYFNLYRKDNKFKHPEPIIIPEGLGKLWMEKNEVKGYGELWLAVQMCKGDTSDHVRPYQDFGIEYGDSSCYKDFAEAKDSHDLWTRVVNKFKEWFPEGVEYQAWNGEKMKMSAGQWASLMFQLVYMHRVPDDKTTFFKMLRHYQVI